MYAFPSYLLLSTQIFHSIGSPCLYKSFHIQNNLFPPNERQKCQGVVSPGDQRGGGRPRVFSGGRVRPELCIYKDMREEFGSEDKERLIIVGLATVMSERW